MIIPNDIVNHITIFLDVKSLLNLAITCRRINGLIKGHHLFKLFKISTIMFEYFDHILNNDVPEIDESNEYMNNLNDLINMMKSCRYLYYKIVSSPIWQYFIGININGRDLYVEKAADPLLEKSCHYYNSRYHDYYFDKKYENTSVRFRLKKLMKLYLQDHDFSQYFSYRYIKHMELDKIPLLCDISCTSDIDIGIYAFEYIPNIYYKNRRIEFYKTDTSNTYKIVENGIKTILNIDDIISVFMVRFGTTKAETNVLFQFILHDIIRF